MGENSTMTSITLKANQLQCDIRPDLGGCIAGLWHDSVAVLRSTKGDELQTVRQCASFPMVPYSNRQAFAHMQWQGATYALTPNFAPEPHAIHGAGWDRAWNVMSSSASSVTLQLQHTADARWPFDFAATQTIVLTGEALSLQMSVTNKAEVPAPVGLGWHPYFAKHGPDHLEFGAQGRWEMNADKLPTVRLPNTGLNQDCAELSVDHCFDGWRGPLHLRNARFAISVTSDLPYLVVFTRPDRDNIAIEPVSHVNNALNLLAQGVANADTLGVRVMQSGETFSAQMRIEVQSSYTQAL
jgi:aldose 1-epimerase